MPGVGLTPCRSWPPGSSLRVIIIDGCLSRTIETDWQIVSSLPDKPKRLRKSHFGPVGAPSHSRVPRQIPKQLPRQGSHTNVQVPQSCVTTTVPATSLIHPLSQSTSPSRSFPSAPQGRLSLTMSSEQNPPSNEPYVARQNTGSTAKFFPLGYKEGFYQWWSCIPAAIAEQRVLSFIPYLQQAPTHRQTGSKADSPDGPDDSLQTLDRTQSAEEAAHSVDDPYGPRRWRSCMVELTGKNRALNEFSVERIGEEVSQNLVIIHGYGAGLGFFYKNFEPLSRARGWQLYALDLLGMGRSTRPPFRIKSKNRTDTITEAEDWFVDALEEWRQKRKIERFTLLGHSLGGYMATAYALKYPGYLNKLVLISPVGIPEDPYAVSADPPDPTESVVASEFTQNQAATTTEVPNPPPRRPLPRWLTYLWDANVSPFSLVRWSGPFGPRLVSSWTHRRFSHLPEGEAQALHDYSYSIFRLRGSGEYALAYILAPGAVARSPLIRRIHGVGRQVIPPSPLSNSASLSSLSTSASLTDALTPTSTIAKSIGSASLTNIQSPPATKRETGIPIVFMYGDHDWMDIDGGYAARDKIEAETRRVLRDATPEERAVDNGSAKVIIIKKAGHHLYLDGWEEFNRVILNEMADVEKRECHVNATRN